jgi:phosphatidylethanolamine/phosphatidyl-N-methylethanolamine N-methyltransferase
MQMTNRWNRFIYRLWAPVYDATVNHFFMPGRRRALELLAIQPGERLLLGGVGTGADLPLLPGGIQVMGIDLSPAMLAKARKKLSNCRPVVQLVLADAQAPLVAEGVFDAALLNLILSVVPDGSACLWATLQSLKTGGRIVIFDKFQPDVGSISPIRRLINRFSTLLGTDITRRFGPMLEGNRCVVISEESSLLNGTYRIYLLQKQ